MTYQSTYDVIQDGAKKADERKTRKRANAHPMHIIAKIRNWVLLMSNAIIYTTNEVVVRVKETN